MGPKHSHHSTKDITLHKQDQLKVQEVINKNHFEFLYVIGRGGFGKVWKVRNKKSSKNYALKEMSKVKILDKKSERSIKYEKHLLSNIRHPFLINMHYAFQDYENLYLVMDLLTGGDLRYHIGRHKKFTEEQTTCIVLGLEYIHNNNIIHRDIKPENLVLDDQGYVRITDFGVAKLYEKENSSETSGTPGYMAPEVMCGQNHTIAVDYFALGVIGYEFMMGKRPYLGKSRKEIKEQILAKQVQIKPYEKPEDWSSEAVDFINRCLQRKASNRLGYKGPQELKDHPWLKYYPWSMLYEKTLEAPFIPKYGDNFDKKYCEMPDKIGNDTKERYNKHLGNQNYSYIFNEFTCYNTESIDYIDNTYGNINSVSSTAVGAYPIYNKTKSNQKNQGQAQIEAAVEKIKSVKVYLNNMNLNKPKLKPEGNNITNSIGLNKFALNPANLEKQKLNLNPILKKITNPIANLKVTNFNTPELKKNPLQNSLNFNNTNNNSNSQQKYTTNLILNKNKASNVNILGKQINQLSISTNTNNSNNSNLSNIPTNHVLNLREKRTNSLTGVVSPSAAMNMLFKSKEALARSTSNFNTNVIKENNLRNKKNSCDINMKEYELFKITKMIQKNSQSTSSSLNLHLNTHLRNESNSTGHGLSVIANVK